MLGQGDRVAGYEVEGVIARGGMGVVYRARHAGLGRIVALKVIGAERAEDPLFRARFVREARLAASLDHPNVIPIFEAGEDDGELFIAMRLVDGSDLERLIARSGPLGLGLVCRIAGQAAAGLDAAHAAGLVHRDVKPANILLAGPDGDPHVYVSDFGVAKTTLAGGELTGASEWIGTPGYAAPEQVRGGEVDGRADVYALGCVLLAALTRGAGPGTQLPAGVAAVIERATAALPGGRYRSAGELAGALAQAGRDAADGELVGAVDPAGVATLPAATRPAPAGRVGGRPVRPRSIGAGRSTDGGRGGWPAVGFVVGFVAIVGGVAAVALTRGGGADHGGGHAGRPSAQTVAVGPTPAAAGGGDTVYCGPAACRQAGRAVVVPIEGGSCVRDGSGGRWTRLDAGAPEPMLICLPGANLPSGGVGVGVPSLIGGRLDHVETALDRLGIAYRTSGGGLFGIVSSSNWTVCATSPPAGGLVGPASEVTVFVEHSC